MYIIHLKTNQHKSHPERAMKGGGATKRVSTLVITSGYLHGRDFGLLTYLTKLKNYGKD